MADERTLEVHVRPPDMEPHAAANQLWYALQDAIDLASDQDQSTWLTSKGKRIAAVVPVEQAERGQVLACPRFTMGASASAGSVLAVGTDGRLAPARWSLESGSPLAVLVVPAREGDTVELCSNGLFRPVARSPEPEEDAVPGQLCASCDPGYGHNNATYAGPPDVHDRASNVW